jgi:long-chain acyl-CoA synthetase
VHRSSAQRAAILLPTSPQFLVALAASDGRGAVLINPLAAPAEVAFQCEDADVGAVLTITDLASRVPGGMPVVLLDDAPRRARVVTPDRTHDVDLGSHHGLSLEGELDVDGRDEEAVIVYTSAMRGTPLGAVLTHRNLLANARSAIDAIGTRGDDHLLALLPLSHLFGLTVTASAPLMVGARVTTLHRFHPVRAADLLASDVSVVVGVPAVYHGLLTGLARRGKSIRGGALRLCVCGGAVLSSELQERWFDATGVELRQGYGLTEAAPVCLYNRTDRPNVRGTLGTAFPGVDVAILPPDTATGVGAVAPLADGIPGEICIRGENVFRGYLHRSDAGLPHHDGWLYTGDEGVRDANGSVTFVRLLKPMFTRNGFNIFPRELERAVMAMPGVDRALVMALPDPVKENDIVLQVWGSVTEADVRAWCDVQLSAYKQPTDVRVFSSGVTA